MWWKLIESPVQTGRLLSHPPEMEACGIFGRQRSPAVIVIWRVLWWDTEVLAAQFPCSNFFYELIFLTAACAGQYQHQGHRQMQSWQSAISPNSWLWFHYLLDMPGLADFLAGSNPSTHHILVLHKNWLPTCLFFRSPFQTPPSPPLSLPSKV